MAMDELTPVPATEHDPRHSVGFQSGQVLPEYAIIVATVSVAAVGALALLGQHVLALYGRLSGLF
jgi:Flp pilus assembly pilin Flp